MGHAKGSRRHAASAVRRRRRHNDATDENVETRIGRHIEPQPDGCWLWTGTTSGRGYGQASGVGVIHRFVYETLVGPIPDDHVLHHQCETKTCCNPAHLVPLTPGDHQREHARLRRSA